MGLDEGEWLSDGDD